MDYNVFRKIIASCVENKRDSLFFRVNIHKLSNKLKDFGLIPILYKDEFISKAVEYEDLFLLAEYFKEDKLNWFDGERTYLPMMFIREEDMTEELQDLLHNLHQARVNCKKKEIETAYGTVSVVNNPCDCCSNCQYNDNNDIKSILISIISKYPCYFVIVAKWVKDDSICLNIRFRASSILINSDKAEGKDNEDGVTDSNDNDLEEEEYNEKETE